jgi:hypothetical protein
MEDALGKRYRNLSFETLKLLCLNMCREDELEKKQVEQNI